MSRDIDLNGVNSSTDCAEAYDMRAWHEEQPAVRVIQPRVHNVLADSIYEQQQAAVLVEAEQPRYRRAALDRQWRGLDAVVANAGTGDTDTVTIDTKNPTVEVDIVDASLDDQAAKRAFWEAFKALGPWWSELPPY
mgnify:CR=1 FL=1